MRRSATLHQALTLQLLEGASSGYYLHIVPGY
jgi:hypothetical protein